MMIKISIHVVTALSFMFTACMAVGSDEVPSERRVSQLVPNHSKFAYVTLLCSPIEQDQAEYVRMLLVLKESIRRFDEENDVVTMVYGGINEEQWELLDREGFKIVQVEDVGAMVSDPEPLRVPDTVSACYRSKLNALHLTQYEKVIYLDNDMLVKQDLRFMFENDGFLAYEGVESPLNAGLFAVDPSEDAFSEIEDILLSDSFHPESGWFGYGPFPHWKLQGHVSDWSFWCAHTDQGILYYYYDKLSKTATILPMTDSADIVVHFTGWSKPVLHGPKDLSDTASSTPSKNDVYEDWYGLWDRVQARWKDSGTLHEHITSSSAAMQSHLRRVLQGNMPY